MTTDGRAQHAKFYKHPISAVGVFGPANRATSAGMDYLAAKSERYFNNDQLLNYQWRPDQQHSDRQRDTGSWHVYAANSADWHRRGQLLNELDVIANVPTKEQIERLQAEMVRMPQIELETDHFFSPGMYCRRVYRPAGTLIVGKIHKKPHFFLCAKGEIIAWTETGMRKLQAGDVVECQPGTKRVTLATQDSIGITIHKTDETDLDKIEVDLVEPDAAALFDSGNRLKSIVADLKKLGETT